MKRTEKLKERELDILADTFFFKGADREFLIRAAAAPGCERGTFRKNDVIYGASSFKKSLGFLLSGSVLVSKDTDDGRRLIISTLGPGELFGAAAIFNDCERYVTVLTAEEKCEVLFFTQEAVKRMMAENFLLTENYLRYLSGRIRFLNGKIESLSAGSADCKLTQYLEANAKAREGPDEVALGMSITELAETLNVGRASLYRAFDALKDAGIAERRGKTVRIPDVSRLKTMDGRE